MAQLSIFGPFRIRHLVKELWRQECRILFTDVRCKRSQGHIRFVFGREGEGKGPLGRPFPVRNAPEELLLAGFADHGHIGRIQVTVFLGTGINSFLGFLLGAVHVGMPYLASDGNRMADMRR